MARTRERTKKTSRPNSLLDTSHLIKDDLLSFALIKDVNIK